MVPRNIALPPRSNPSLIASRAPPRTASAGALDAPNVPDYAL